MEAIARPTPPQRRRRLIVLGAAIAAILVPLIQNLAGLGLSQAEFSAAGDSTLRVEGYAFTIWSVIYLGILAYAIRQVLPQTPESDIIRRMGWPSVIAFGAIALWIVAAALGQQWLTVVLIFTAVLALVVPMIRHAGDIRALLRTDMDRWLVVWPLGLLAGWLMIAAPLNLLSAMTATDTLPAFLSPDAWALAAIALVSLVTLGVVARLGLLAIAIPVSWGLLGAFVAEQADNPLVGFAALAASLIVLIGAIVIVFQLRPDVVKPARY